MLVTALGVALEVEIQENLRCLFSLSVRSHSSGGMSHHVQVNVPKVDTVIFTCMTILE